MKSFRICILALLFGAITICFGQQNQGKIATTTIIEIAGMACQEGCADAINNNLKKLEGVMKSEVSYETGKAIVTYYPQQVPLDSITHQITTTKVKNYNYVIKAIETKE